MSDQKLKDGLQQPPSGLDNLPNLFHRDPALCEAVDAEIKASLPTPEEEERLGLHFTT